MSSKTIAIRGAREHNLKGINLDIPRDQLVVITGLSGSGKSSLAFDTIYAEGQRKYMESLSAYARQFLDQLQKPDIESIEGLPPTIAIEQRSSSHNPRSTVATTTEIYDYLRLLFARVGQPRCWHVMGADAAAETTDMADDIEPTPRAKVAKKKTKPAKKAATKKRSGKADLKVSDPGVDSVDADPSPSTPSNAAAKNVSLPVCGHPIAAQSATQIVDFVNGLPEGSKVMILAPLVRGKKGHHKEIFESMVRQGFVRARADGQVIDLRELKAGTPFTTKLQRYQAHHVEAVVDRVVIKQGDDAARQRLADSIELSLKLAEGLVIISTEKSPESRIRSSESKPSDAASTTRNPELETRNSSWIDTLYSEKYACPMHPECSLPELEPRLFSFNSPYGACPSCSGLGTILEFDEELIVPDTTLSLKGGAVAAWRKHGMRFNIFYKRIIRRFCKDFGVSAEIPFNLLPKPIQRILVHGTNAADEAAYGTHFEGVIPNLQRRWVNTESEYVKEALHEYQSEAPCELCRGARLKVEARNVFIEVEERHEGTEARRHDGKTSAGRAFNITSVTGMTIERAVDFFTSLRLTAEQQQIAAPILKEINARLGFMLSVGLGYLTLDRTTASLSGGEAQRIRLATQVGSGLVGCCYVLDEPTIGLHQRDNDRLIKTLRHLTDIGNTVIVVEHDEDTIRAADYLIDIGPGPGRHGGQVIAAGPLRKVLADNHSLTAKYLSGTLEIATPTQRRRLDHKKAIVVKGARENNLKNIDVAFPLGGIVCVTGVSGSGKSTLVNQILLRAARKHLLASRDKPGDHDKVTGLDHIDRMIEVDQSPIGRTPRSNPATYTGVFDLVRELFSQTKEAKIRGYKPGRFSFNVKGGRCESCMGQGTKKIEMHFLPDVYVECEVCKGKRYNRETLEVHYRGKTIADVLAMTVEEALAFFDNFSKIKDLLAALNDVGLSYVQLGQASTTLSGGEAQRVKLATELGKRPTGHTLYILDEPTTGLHFADVDKLLHVLARLADAGNSLFIIEHNMDVIKCADWVLDMGPQGGDRGGTLVASGTPEDVVDVKASYTGQFLATHMKVSRELVGAV